MGKIVSLTSSLAIVASFLTCAYAAKILVVVPQLFSVCRRQATLAHELTSRGHDVTIYISAAAEREFLFPCLQGCGRSVKNVTWDQDKLPIKGDQLWKHALGNDGIDYLDEKMIEMLKDLCIPQIADTRAMDTLREQRFDIALMEGSFALSCFYVVPHLLNIPYITESSFLNDFPRIRPWLPHVVPSTGLPYSDSMTFFEKFQNVISFVMTYALAIFMVPIKEINEYAPDLSRYDVVSLIEKSELFLENIDPVAGYPSPTWPNVLQVGGFSTKPAKPLAKEYSEFIKNSENGLIVLSFGSVFTPIPESVIGKIQTSLRNLKYNFIVKAEPNKQVGNILFRKWLPQNDLLGHNQTILFIAHCGNNGLYEAIYHGVPMLCLPIGVDQHYNAKRVERLGFGKKLDISSFTSDQLTEGILSIVENKEYRNKAKILSSKFHGLPQHPREKALDWIEYVIKHGGQHLRPRALDMPLYEYFMLDIIGAVMLVLHLSIYVVVKVIGVLCRRLCKGKIKRD